MKREDIQEHLDRYDDYDIRKNHNCRFVDHKCTPDVVCFIADCILSTDCATKSFTVSDLWKTQFFIKNTRIVFHKPYADDRNAHNEYNKVLSQPLKLLAYAHVLEVDDAQRLLVFRINNMELLEYIASRERNAFNFLEVFFRKVVSESGIGRFFEEYKERCKNVTVGEIRAAKNILYGKYHRFISANTPTQSKLDTNRMLHKVLNIFAYAEMIPGSNGKIPDWGDFMYNKVNWRDEGKDKTLTRNEAAAKETDDINANFYEEYQVDKAIKNVKHKQGDVSEVRDELATGIATEVHHIFPKSQFPMISSYYENLILLTSSQHRQKAHPKGNTQVIDKDYQLTCLMSKSQTIEKSLNGGETFYRKESFVYVINTGLTEHLSETTTFTDIRKFLVKKYLEF